MKKLLFALCASLPLLGNAQTVNLDLSYTAAPLGQASQAAAVLYGLDNSLTYTATLRQLTVDAAGGLKGSTSTAQLVALTSSYVYASSTVMTATTSGLAVNISHVAGASCNDCRVYWQAPASIYWDYGNANSVPATLGATTGFTLTANVTPLLDDGFIDGQFLYLKAQTGTVTIPVTIRKRQ